MKGLIFTEFLNMTELKFGDTILDQIIQKANLPNNGAYTSVGTYEHVELVNLVVELSHQTHVEINVLLKEFGKYLFLVFHERYGNMFEGINDGFTFLKYVENTIHKEVLKLYPEAELPSLVVHQIDERLEVTYSSGRKMSDFAEGLMLGCFSYFKEEVTINKDYIEDDGSKVQFVITKN
nr:heme NO-binding domain-containing protein [uncultured Carboxylicivirga sp.]